MIWRAAAPRADEDMPARRRYRRRPDSFVVAIQLDLDTSGFTFYKWGSEQRCKRGDWIVDNGKDVHTVDREVFERTYRKVGAGRYVKTTPVWAEVATADGSVMTREGRSHYKAGDYIVTNEEDGGDAYCIEAAQFEEMYEPDE
jgi:hypothetical protein